MSSNIFKTYLAGQSATEPHNATATAVASNISWRLTPKPTLLLTWYSIQP
jgi:hypothetical protein